MADTTTTNYGLTKPEVGGSPDTWGTKNNENWDDVDSIVKAVSNVANAALPAASFTAAAMMTAIKSVDGAGSGLDADFLDGGSGAYYTNLDNMTSGQLASARAVKYLKHVGAYSSGNVTVSTAAPSGGADGDVWLKV